MTSDNEVLKTYVAGIERALKTGQSGEHTHRPALEMLIESLGGHDVDAINEPRQIKCGAPDFIVVRGTVPLGYIEAKDVGLDLVKIEKGEQLIRYRESLTNLVLTDCLSFRWYLDGQLRLTAELPRPGANGRIRWDDDAASQVAQLLNQFLLADIPLRSTPQDLAVRMAGLARLIRNLIEQTFHAENDAGDLHNQLAAFRQVLIESLTVEQFADMYAQTLCYGLFAARCNTSALGFTRQSAASALPKTNPFLRKLFNTIAGPDLDERIAWAVDQLALLLARADMSAILADFGKRTRKEDPVVHFYETFLGAYDAKMRKARGVYYTPEPVVGYIVRSVDALLKREFKLKDGLADSSKVRWKTLKVQTEHGKRKTSTKITEIEPWAHKVQILDPATGTGTFLYSVIQQIRAGFDDNVGAWPAYVADHLLPRLFGFELLMAPYAVAHMKLGIELEQSGYDFASDQRLGVFLTNSLDEAHEMTKLPGFSSWLAEEANAAADVKKDSPVMVVLGNPPYKGHSANSGKWIAGLLRGHDSLSKSSTENYFQCDGARLKERNPKWLNDDYVKFIRFAQWRIEQTGHGILAFVTNHGYLDNPTFRGMRQSLMMTFDKIYLLDLHGNSKKKEEAPDGGRDVNVFDIQQGVAIGIFVKHADSSKLSGAKKLQKDCRMFHSSIYGTRIHKYSILDSSDVESTDWMELNPSKPNYYFVPEDSTLRDEYEQGWKISDVMLVNNVGIVTARDALTIHFDRDSAWRTVCDFSDLSEHAAREKFHLPKDSQDWTVNLAQRDLKESGPSQDRLAKILYRPFDVRHTYFTGRPSGFHCRPRTDVMNHLLHQNIALLVPKQTKDEWSAFVSRHLVAHKAITVYDISSAFPLWLYAEKRTDLFDAAPIERTPNLTAEFVAALAKPLGVSPEPEDALAYIYGVFHIPTYRLRYSEFLKRDFPRVPITSDVGLFAQLVSAGKELIALHTFEAAPKRITRFEVRGTNLVDNVSFSFPPSSSAVGSADLDRRGQLRINAEQYFDGVPESVWNVSIGGYRVAEKWLKDRKGLHLSYDDLTHFQAIIASLDRTLAIQRELEGAVILAGGWPLR